jgi:hypothetical protein
MANLRTAEWVNLLFFALFTALACLRPLPLQRRTAAVLLGMAGLILTIGPQVLERHCPFPALSIVRDWMPAALIPVAYWQTGTFVAERRSGLEQRLQRFDLMLLSKWKGKWQGAAQSFLELAYLLCYPLIPAGLAVLYLSGHRAQSDWYWTQVLPPTYLCYVVVPFLHVLPPRLLETEASIAAGGVRN